MKKRVFGFDVGISSLGWAVIDMDDDKDPEKQEEVCGEIISAGVRIFPGAENRKDGKSLAMPRRQKRLARRVCRRKALRKKDLKKLFVEKGLVGETDFVRKNVPLADVWDLRVQGLSRRLSGEELARVLLHLAKHRGFKSYRKAQEKEEEGGKVLEALSKNKALLSENENKTLAQIFVERGGKKRNFCRTVTKNGTEKTEACFDNLFTREEIIREAGLIFDRQRTFGSEFASPEFEEAFGEIAFRHREVDVQGVEKMLGVCPFEKDEKRAPKEAPSAEFFVALGKINSMSVLEGGRKRPLTEGERAALFDLLKARKKVTYRDIRQKVFNSPSEDDFRFSDVEYNPRPKYDKKTKELIVNKKAPEEKEFYSLKGYHALKGLIGEAYDIPTQDKIVSVIAIQKNDKNIEGQLKELGIHPDDIETLKGVSFSKFIGLSLKAVYRLLPEMEAGKKYNEACKAVGYDFKSTGEPFSREKGRFLPPIPQKLLTRVPVVNRAVSQFRKVYNAMVRAYGTPDQINVEMGRDIYNNAQDRKKIQKAQEEFRELKDAARQKAEERLGYGNVSAKVLLKFRLYEEQDGKSVYSGRSIDLHRLANEPDYCDVDHIIPYSRCLDDSLNNKVLCFSSENREKSNRTPLEYLPAESRADFIGRVMSMKGIKSAKRDRLLIENFSAKEAEFRERNINDTRYMAKYLIKYLDDCIDFSGSSAILKDRVQSRSGGLTDFLRYQWGLKKDRSENDLHHAQDAIVIACATNGYTKYLAHLSKIFENKQRYAEKYGEAWYKAFKRHLKAPWDGFYEDVQKALAKIFVSRSPRKNATGELHKETICTLKPSHREFKEENVKSGFKVRGGIAGNGEMLRVDVFSKKNKRGKEQYYLVPVYLKDMAAKVLPNKAVVVGKPEEEWLEMDESYVFKFSLFPDDLCFVQKGEKIIFGYYKGANRATASITLEGHDRSFMKEGIGVKTQDRIKKFQVDPLGRYVEVKSEKRLPLKPKSAEQRRRDRWKNDFYKKHPDTK